MRTGRVIAWVYEITVTNARFIVSKAGRERVLREGAKNVHAFVEGYVCLESLNLSGAKKVSYNPKKKDHFFYKSNGRAITDAQVVKLTCSGVLAIK
jgi:hypothetical protein